MKTLIALITLLLIVLIGGRLITGQTGRAQQPVPREPLVQPENKTEDQTETDILPEWASSPNSEEELPAYFQVIIDNNLFRPLGWTETPKRYTDYRLLGTLTESETPARAILQERSSKQTRVVTLGETIGDFHVFRIQHKQVTLKKGQQLVLLLLDETLFLSPTPKVVGESY